MKNNVDFTNAVLTVGEVVPVGAVTDIAKIADLLSKNTYTDPVMAAIREIVCNAKDAHKTVSNDNPVDITLPDRDGSTFVVRDYGPGMSYEAIMSLYFSWGATTKDGTNTLVGCFGIGSKAPLAYAKEYNIYSYQAGKLNSYNVFLDPSGLNMKRIRIDKATSEPDGFKVEFKVKDASEFNQKFYEFWKYFDFPLNVVRGLPSRSAAKPVLNILIDCGNFFLQEKANYGDSSLYILMGGVLYKVSKDSLNYSTKRLFDTVCDDLIPWRTKLVLRAEIGDISVAASREDARMDSTTVEYIESRLKAITEDRLAEQYKRDRNWAELSIAEKLSTLEKDGDRVIRSNVLRAFREEIGEQLVSAVREELSLEQDTPFPEDLTIKTNRYSSRKSAWRDVSVYAELTEATLFNECDLLYSPTGIIDGAFKRSLSGKYGAVVTDERLYNALVKCGFTFAMSVHTVKNTVKKERELASMKYYEYSPSAACSTQFVCKGRRPTLQRLLAINKSEEIFVVSLSHDSATRINPQRNPGMERHFGSSLVTPDMIQRFVNVANRLWRSVLCNDGDSYKYKYPVIFATSSEKEYNAAVDAGVRPLASFMDMCLQFNKRELKTVRKAIVTAAQYKVVSSNLSRTFINTMSLPGAFGEAICAARSITELSANLRSEWLSLHLDELTRHGEYTGSLLTELHELFTKTVEQLFGFAHAIDAKYPLLSERKGRYYYLSDEEHILEYIKLCDKLEKREKGGEK